jgi:hypothetical protein
VTGLARYALAISALLLMASGSATAVTPARQVEYLYINANEGTASGGHAAIRFGDQVFHFEHRAPGILVLARDGFERFRHLYGDLENRTIRVSRIPVSDETTISSSPSSMAPPRQRQRLEALEVSAAIAYRDPAAGARREGSASSPRRPAAKPAWSPYARASSLVRSGFIARRSAELAARLAR